MLAAGHSYTLGIEVGPNEVSWARAVRGQQGIEIVASARAPAMVGVDSHGTLTALPAAGDPSLTAVTSGFVDLLGTSEAIVVATTPYGPEALLACVLASVRAANEAAAGSAAVAVTVVRGGDVDEFRATLLLEAVRLAGFPPDAVRMVWVDDAIAVAGRGPIVAAEAAAIDAWTDVADDPATSRAADVGLAAGAGTIAGAGAGAATLGAAGAPHLIDDAGVGAAAPVPNDGALPGPDGSVAGSVAGPPGSDGATIGPDGATTAGPAGPAAAGPTGGVEGSTRPSWFPVAVGVVVAAAIVAVMFVVLPSSGSEEGAPASVVETAVESVGAVATAAVEPASSEGVSVASAPSSGAPATTEPAVEVSTAPAPAGLDPASFVGAWQQECSADSGAFYSVRYTVTQTGADQLTEVTSAGIHQTSDCSDAPTLPTEEVLVWTVVGETVVDGLPTLQLTSDKGVNIRAIDGDTVFTAWAAPGSDFPTAFDPALESTRM